LANGMTAQEIEKTVCPHCSGVLDAGDEICRHCGAPTSRPRSAAPSHDPTAAAEPVFDQPKPRPDMAERRGMVLVLLFLVLGVLALPLLWRSSKFSPAWKIILTILVAIQTAIVVWLLWYVIHLFIESLREYGIIEAP